MAISVESWSLVSEESLSLKLKNAAINLVKLLRKTVRILIISNEKELPIFFAIDDALVARDIAILMDIVLYFCPNSIVELKATQLNINLRLPADILLLKSGIRMIIGRTDVIYL